MKIAVLSDIHGNLIALNQCIESIREKNVDRVVFLGDAVGYFCDGNAVVDVLRSINADCLKGNHDAMLLGELEVNPERDKVYRLMRTKLQMTAENIDFFDDLEASKEELIDNLKVLYVHGSPTDPTMGYVYPDSELDAFSGLGYDAVFMGHTHHPFIAKISDSTFINVGSVGLPRDHGNLLSFALFDTELRTIEIIRQKLNVELIKSIYGEEVHSSVLGVLSRNTLDRKVGPTAVL